MTSITDLAAAVFRDYVTDGVPESGAKDPAKLDIRALFEAIATGAATFTGSENNEGIFPLLPGQDPPFRAPAIAVGSSGQDGIGASTFSTIFNNATSIAFNRSVTPLGHNRSVNVNPLRTDVGTDFAHGPAGDPPSDNADSTSFRWQGMGGNRTTVLASDVDAADTSISITVNTATGFYPLTAGDPDEGGGGSTQNEWSQDLGILLGVPGDPPELIIPTAYDNGTGVLTGCERGARGTTANVKATWPAGTVVTLFRMFTYASLQFWNHKNTTGDMEGSLRLFVPSGVWDGATDQRGKVVEFAARGYTDRDGAIVGKGVEVPNGSAFKAHPGGNTNLSIRVGSVYATLCTITASVVGDGADTGYGTMTVTAASANAIVDGAQVDWGGGVRTRVLPLGLASTTGTGGTGTYRVTLEDDVASAAATVYDPTTYIGAGLYANNQDLRVATNNGTDLWQFKASQLHSTPGSLQLASGTAAPAGGTQDIGLRFSSANHFGIFFGSGAPTLVAGQGSLYLRTDGSGTTDRMYVNTNGNTTWTAVVTVA